MAGVVAAAGAGFHRMSLNTQRKSSGVKQDLKEGCEEADDHHLRRAPTRLSSASSLARHLLLLFAMVFLGVLVLERERAWVSKSLEGRGFGERLGAPEILIYGTGAEIVAGDRGAYPKKFGKWSDSLDRTVAESFGIHVESYSV
jgi:hypothetical protein